MWIIGMSTQYFFSINGACWLLFCSGALFCSGQSYVVCELLIVDVAFGWELTAKLGRGMLMN